MNEDYLWDRSGPPDPEIERLERTLAPLRYRHRAKLCETPHQSAVAWWAIPAAAAVVLAAVALRDAHPATRGYRVGGGQRSRASQLGQPSGGRRHAAARRADGRDR